MNYSKIIVFIFFPDVWRGFLEDLKKEGFHLSQIKSGPSCFFSLLLNQDLFSDAHLISTSLKVLFLTLDVWLITPNSLGVIYQICINIVGGSYLLVYLMQLNGDFVYWLLFKQMDL